jgi:GTP pyrophosphokinase
MDPARQIGLEWAPETDELYPVRIHILCHDRMGLLANITAALSEAEANILDAAVKTRGDKRADCYFTLSVSGAEHLDNIIKSVKRIRHVIKVSRIAA